jgi:transcriptional regulator with XRE-family HTH domain
MNRQVSLNIRYLLWRKGLPRQQWESWLTSHTKLPLTTSTRLVGGRLADDQVEEKLLDELARAFGHEDAGETLRYTDLPREGCNVLLENLKFLFGSVGHGGKKALAADLSVDPTTVSRWLSGSYEPQGSSLRQLVAYFGLPPETDLRETAVFLSVEPVAATERRRWIHARIDLLSSEEFRDLYPAFRRMLGER